MSTSIYCAVAINEDTRSAVTDAIQERYPESQELIPGVFLISTDDSANDVAVGIGVRPDEDEDEPRHGSGIVLRLNGSFAGYGDRELGLWFRAYAGSS
ncbi:MAG: hypothetical protein F4Y97_05525 [Dehalococcoidia bacterium]|nr:hypothetical protein [Dehalococcoidia bacterium]